MTWPAVRDLPAEQTVAVLPTGAIEAHGPHLPLGTDIVIAEAMARAGAERLAGRGLHVLVLPSLRAAVDEVASSGGGTLVFPDLTRRRWAARLTAEFQSGACHAGRYEGSIVLAEC